MEVEERGSSSDFGSLLRRHRLAAGLSQEALAERARMSSDGISALERGHRRTPQRETLMLLAGALALDDEQLKELQRAASRPPIPRHGSVTVGPWPDAASANLALSLSSFVGRETELAEISALVREHRLVTLTGAGGVGKTQTALQVGAAFKAPEIEVAFVDLARLRDAAFVTAATALALGVQEVKDRPLLRTLAGYLKNKAVLLIFDNCEHVVAETARVISELLIACPSLRVLASSREPLKAAGEFNYRLPSLSVPPPEKFRFLEVRDAMEYGGIRLFIDRARSVDHRFELTKERVPTVAEICRRLDGIPLAIELAAARVNVLSLESLAQRLDDRFRILTTGERVAPRQRTMRATIDWSYALLGAKEQRVFERLSVFVGGCTLESAVAVCADEDVAEDQILDILSSLLDKSLLVVDEGETEYRYRLLETFRQYGEAKLATRCEQNAVARRHAQECLELGERLERAFEFGPDRLWRSIAHAELHNWQAALRWALTDRNDVALGQRLAAQLRVAWGLFIFEGRIWLPAALNLADERTPTDLLAKLNCARAELAAKDYEFETAIEHGNVAVDLYGTNGDPLGLAVAHYCVGWALMNLGRIEESRMRLQQALLVRRHGDSRLVGSVLRHLGNASAEEHDFVTARRYVADALRIFRELDRGVEAAWCESELASFAMSEGKPELALGQATSALAKLRGFNLDARGLAWLINRVARYLIDLGRYGEGAKYARDALLLANEIQLGLFVAEALDCLAIATSLRNGTEKSAAPSSMNAARVMGFAGSRRAVFKGSDEHLSLAQHDRALSVLREVFGSDAVAEYLAQGAALSEDEALELARSLCVQSSEV